jgi:hypothetical protein
MTTINDLHDDAALVITGPPQWAGELELREPLGPEATLLTMDRQGNAIAFSGKVEYGQDIRGGFPSLSPTSWTCILIQFASFWAILIWCLMTEEPLAAYRR